MRNSYDTDLRYKIIQFVCRLSLLLLLLCLSRPSFSASYSSSSVAQVTGNVAPGASDQQVVVVTVNGSSSGILQDWKINSCAFTMSNTNNADVTAAKLWMSSTNNFGSATQVGATINNPTGTITFTVNSSAIGNNSRYLFLTFTIASGAPCSGNSVDAFVPTNGLVIGSAGLINGGGAGNKTPSPNNPAGNRPIFNQVTPSIGITSTGGGGCEGSLLTYTATPVNGGGAPDFQWKVNGVNVGTNSSLFSSASLANGDQVQCELTSNANCASPVTVLSNTLTVSLNSLPRPKVIPFDTLVCTGTVFTITAIDTGAYSGGYPPGTLFDFGFGPSTSNTFLVNGPGIYNVSVTLPAASGSCFATSDIPNIFYVDAPVAILSADTLSCNGQTNANVYAEAFLGTLPFRYKWYHNGQVVKDTISSESTDTLKNAGAGTYCLVISDSIAGQSNLVCASDSACIEVMSPAPLLISGITNDISCQGYTDGAIQVSVTGGTNPYNYLWSNGNTGEDLSQLAPGTYTLTVTDQHACSASTVFTIITLMDTTPPSLNCPLNISVSAPPGACSAVVTYVLPDGTDNCPGVHTVQTTGLPPGSVFPPGETVNTFVATDSAGNTTTCTFVVTVEDTEPPVLTCSSDIQATNDPGTCGAVVTYTMPAVTENCSAAGIIQLTGLPSGSVFPIGTTINSFQASDSAGNISTCSFQVIVSDTSLPLISSMPDTVLTNDPGQCGAVFVYNVSASDNCSATLNQTTGLSSGVLFPVGSTLNSYTATDPSGNSVTCSFTVTVIDNQAPVAACQNISVVLDSGGFIVLDPLMIDAGSTDNCGIASRTLSADTLFCQHTGDNTITLTITDVNGNQSSCTSIVTVSSTLAANIIPVPAELCLGNNLVLSGNPTGGSGIYTSHLWSGENTDLSDTNNQQPVFTGSSVGVFELFYQVSDDKGCQATDQVSVTVYPDLVTSLSFSNVTCNGGSDGAVNTTVSGGSGLVSYLWSNGSTLSVLNNLAMGTYTVTISDAAGCSDVLTTAITEPAALTLNTSSTPSSCGALPDGTANVIVSGGVFPYSYLWSNGETVSSISGLSAGIYTVTVTDQHGCTIAADATVIPLTIDLQLTVPVLNGGYNISCAGGNNGSVDLIVLSGAGPFSYLWSNGATTEDLASLLAGSYTVTVSNGFCTSTSSVTLTEPIAITVISSSTDVSCFGGSNGTASVMASGGVSGYQYEWNTIPVKTTAEADNLPAGNYNVTVSDGNGCQISHPVLISQPIAVSTSASITNLKCKGDASGAINLTAGGGTPPYSYQWNTGVTLEDISGLKAKTYIVTVTDSHGCTKKSSFQVTEPFLYMQLFTNKTNVRCWGGNTGKASIFVLGGVAPYTYLWNTVPVATTSSLNNITAGTYQCQVTDAGGCSKTVTLVITQPSQLVLTTSFSNVTTNGGNDGSASVSVSGGTPNYSYKWNIPPPNNSSSVNNLTAGVYSVKVTDSKGCTKTAVITITQPGPRLADVSGDSQAHLAVFPNPSLGLVTLEFGHFQNRNLNLNLYDLLGNKVFKDQVTGIPGRMNRYDYNFSGLPKGIYLLELTGKGNRLVKRLVLQ